MAELTQFRDNFGVHVIDKDEEHQQFDTALTDFDATIMTQYQLCAAISNTPATKLMGTSPKGFNATGEFEVESYHEELESIQEMDFDQIIERHHICMMKSDIEPEFGQSFEIDIVWNPLKIESRKEKAEINEINARRDAIYVDSGVVSQEEVRDRLIADEDSGYDGLNSIDHEGGELFGLPSGELDPESEEHALDPSQSLNGAQVTALTSIIDKIRDNEITKETAARLMTASFPMSEEQARAILEEVVQGANIEQATKPKQEAEISPGMDENDILDALCEGEDAEDAEYQGKTVTLNKPFSNKGGKSKYAVYVKNDKGNVVKVSFGDPNMEIRRDNPEARKNFRARHNCSEKTDKTKAGYWACKLWSSKPVSEIVS